jgi:hypothetical protein
MPTDANTSPTGPMPVPVSMLWGNLRPGEYPDLKAPDCYPYYVTKVAPCLFHVIVLPDDWTREQHSEFAQDQAHFNHLDACVVYGDAEAIYISPSGAETGSTSIPRGGHFIVDDIEPCCDISYHSEWIVRYSRLRQFMLEYPGCQVPWYDLTKGGRPATRQEMAKYQTKKFITIPDGLTKCYSCGEWNGECFDPDPMFAGLIMTVSCKCRHNNRCASCGRVVGR